MRLLGAYAYHGYSDYARAAAQYEKVLRLQPNNSDAYQDLGRVQRRQGRWLESLANLRKAVELEPGNESYMMNLSVTLRCGRRWDEVNALQRQLLAMEPDVIRDPLRYAKTELLSSGTFRFVDGWLTRLAPAQLASPRVVEVRKFLVCRKGDYAGWKRLDGLQPYFEEDGEPHWLQALDAAVFMAANGDTAQAHARLGSFPTELRSNLEREPANNRMRCALSLMEALLGEKEAALRDVRKAVELIPESLDAYSGPAASYNLAIVWAWTGDKDRALAELARLLRIPSGLLSNDKEIPSSLADLT